MSEVNEYETMTIDSIKLIDGTVVNLANVLSIDIPSLAEVKVYPQYSTLDGTVEKISGTEDDYLLTLDNTPAEAESEGE